jgi:hypothetical protein
LTGGHRNAADHDVERKRNAESGKRFYGGGQTGQKCIGDGMGNLNQFRHKNQGEKKENYRF